MAFVASAAGPSGSPARLRTEGGGDIWLLGGARAIRPFLDQGLVDQLEIFVMPILLGDGIPLFARSQSRHVLRLTKSQTYEGGAVRLVYELAAD